MDVRRRSFLLFPDRGYLPAPQVKRLSVPGEHEFASRLVVVLKTEKTFLMTPFSQERHFFPLESSPTRCRR